MRNMWLSGLSQSANIDSIQFRINAIEKVQKMPVSSFYFKLHLQSDNPRPWNFRSQQRKLCGKFAKKVFEHPVHKNMFTLKEGRSTRSQNVIKISSR